MTTIVTINADTMTTRSIFQKSKGRLRMRISHWTPLKD